MANQKEKIFALMYETNEPTKLREFVDEICEYKRGTDNKKYLTWANYCNFYTLATLENTYWNVQKLTDAIHKHMNKNIKFIVFEIQDTPAQGRMDPKYWTFWNQAQNLTQTIDNYTRARKLKKLTKYINTKRELERKEQEITRRKIELKKALSLKKRENEIKSQEAELEEMEKELHGESEVPTKRKRRWGRKNDK